MYEAITTEDQFAIMEDSMKEHFLEVMHDKMTKERWYRENDVIKALKLSLWKWRAIAQGANIDHYDDTCALCGLFTNGELHIDMVEEGELNHSCEKCPLCSIDDTEQIESPYRYIHCSRSGHPWIEYSTLETSENAWKVVDAIRHQLKMRYVSDEQMGKL